MAQSGDDSWMGRQAQADELVAGGPPDETDLLKAEEYYRRQIEAHQVQQANRRQLKKFPPGARRVEAFRATKPAPALVRDPNERAPAVAAGAASSVAASGSSAVQPSQPVSPQAAPSPLPPVGLGLRYHNVAQILEAIGHLYANTVDRDAVKARRELRNNIMLHLHELVPEVGSFKELVTLTLDIDSHQGESPQEKTKDDRAAFYRAFLSGESVERWAQK